jgi:lipopolysaccharide/colanic/teichoic acid biosynthesis glycosyltransferase
MFLIKTGLELRDLSRRLMDIVVSLSAVAILAPFLILISFLIMISNGPPVLFRQRRVGKNGKPFNILKFRTMNESGDQPAVTAAGDARVTKLGKYLRGLKLDELPQFINVLKGEMSLIGPRPEIPRFVDPQDMLWQEILQVRPGITDVATLCFRNEEQILGCARNKEYVYRRDILPTKLRLNRRYLVSRTWRTDGTLLWLTLKYSVFRNAVDYRKIAHSFNIPESELRIACTTRFSDGQEEMVSK